MKVTNTYCDICHKQILKEKGEAIVHLNTSVYRNSHLYVNSLEMCENCYDKMIDYLKKNVDK